MSHYDPQRDPARSGQVRAAAQNYSFESDQTSDWEEIVEYTAPDSQSTYAGQTSPAQGVREERRATPSSRQILESNGDRGLRQGSQSGAPTNAPCAGTAMESANPPNKSPAVLREEKRKEDQEKELEQLERKICTADADIQSLQIELDTITREKANRAREEADRREQTLVNCEQCKSREENINALRDAIDKTKKDLSELEEEENSQGEQLACARQRAEATIAEEQRKQEKLTKRKKDLVNLKKSIADLDKERQAKPKERISVKEEHVKRYHLVNKECEYQNCKKRLTPDSWYCCHECSDCNFCGACFQEAWKRHAGGMHSFTDMTYFTCTVANTHLKHIKSALEKNWAD